MLPETDPSGTLQVTGMFLLVFFGKPHHRNMGLLKISEMALYNNYTQSQVYNQLPQQILSITIPILDFKNCVLMEIGNPFYTHEYLWHATTK